MDEPRPPVVYVISLGRSAHLIEWQRRADGWWAHVAWLSFAPSVGWSKGRQIFEDHDEWVPASAAQRREGWDYSRVPRLRA